MFFTTQLFAASARIPGVWFTEVAAVVAVANIRTHPMEVAEAADKSS